MYIMLNHVDILYIPPFVRVFVATQNEISWQTEIYLYDEHESRPQANLLIFFAV